MWNLPSEVLTDMTHSALNQYMYPFPFQCHHCTLYLCSFMHVMSLKSVYLVVATSELWTAGGQSSLFVLVPYHVSQNLEPSSTTVCWIQWDSTENNSFQFSGQSSWRWWEEKEYSAAVASWGGYALEDNSRSRHLYLLGYIIYKIKKRKLVISSEG